MRQITKSILKPEGKSSNQAEDDVAPVFGAEKKATSPDVVAEKKDNFIAGAASSKRPAWALPEDAAKVKYKFLC
jgi:hypothetical protein